VFAARVTDTTSHQPPVPGVITGPGGLTVLIEGLPAAVEGDSVTCTPPPPPPPHSSTFPSGSLTVRIGGRAALRVGDSAGCGASIVRGATKVQIG
jgi:uncharacterized Zn-binding protein involved in type VI secretion